MKHGLFVHAAALTLTWVAGLMARTVFLSRPNLQKKTKKINRKRI